MERATWQETGPQSYYCKELDSVKKNELESEVSPIVSRWEFSLADTLNLAYDTLSRKPNHTLLNIWSAELWLINDCFFKPLSLW